MPDPCLTNKITSTTRKRSQRYFWPAEYTTKTKPKTNLKTNPNPKNKLIISLGLVLGFGLVCTPLGKNIVGSFFRSYLLLFRALHQQYSFQPITSSCLRLSKYFSHATHERYFSLSLFFFWHSFELKVKPKLSSSLKYIKVRLYVCLFVFMVLFCSSFGSRSERPRALQLLIKMLIRWCLMWEGLVLLYRNFLFKWRLTNETFVIDSFYFTERCQSHRVSLHIPFDPMLAR